MSLWEYKHITSGPHGFATPALLESYLNQLGKDEWEIISFQPNASNPLAFNGIARRTTLRDWTLESAAAAAAKAEADKLRAEFAAKFQGQTPVSESAVEKPASLVAETAAPEDGLRKLRDTERDGDPDAADGEDWDEWDSYEDDLPTFFEAIKPHLRKNQRGPGQSVSVTFLAKRWEQTEGDMINALKECGFVIPEREDDPPEHLEFEGDLYWLNLNNRHELFINTREKPRPVFRVAQAKKLDPADPASAVLAEEAAAEQAEKARREAERAAREAEQAARRAEHEARRAAAQAAREAAQAAAAAARAEATGGGGDQAAAPAAGVEGAAPPAEASPEAPAGPLPQGEELLAAIRLQMRRNRRGPGYSGSMSYLSRAFKHTEAEIVAALGALGLHVPENASEKPVKTVLGSHVYWLNKDSRGGIWINGDETRGPKPDQAAAKPAETVAGPAPEPVPSAASETAPAAAELVEPAAEAPAASEPVVAGDAAVSSALSEPAPEEPAAEETEARTPAATPEALEVDDPASPPETQPADETTPSVKRKAARSGTKKAGASKPRTRRAPQPE